MCGIFAAFGVRGDQSANRCANARLLQLYRGMRAQRKGQAHSLAAC